ncbi:MAG: energy transducer TonB [Gammaproteobacteria bacterium]|nr:energy transducer TonB [Gammaproteobacteria bacterium]MBU1603254.1 energy transducer TonB [Gammaproteobacteria bacterium]MBU2432774.1 energy transducer TonB [Gammaproteobacteria bacterium]MBU2450017.1 energy transducer TonB [Gammaproteobacteria bacterium]
MSYTLSRPSPFQRSGLLAVVVGLHVGVLLLILVARTVVPQIMEIPLVVDLLPAPEIAKPPAAQAVPKARPVPVKAVQAPQPKPAAPVVEATQSVVPAPAAVLAAPVEAKPVPVAPPVETISQARFDADYLRNPSPLYPPLARRMGEEGKVVLRVSVNAQGSADSVEIRTSSGSQRLDESAQKTVRNWKFIPAKRGDVAVQSWVLVPIIFKLEQ